MADVATGDTPSTRRFVSRVCHPIFGNVVRCGYGHFHRKGETSPCEEKFYSASDPEVLTEQLALAGWTKRRVRVPKAFRAQHGGIERATQYLCPGHGGKVTTGKVAVA